MTDVTANLHLRRMNLGDLKGAPYNPRRISEEALQGLGRSIERFGLVEPIVWNQRTEHVVGGHQRLRVLQKAGVQETQVVVVDLDEKEERALNLSLNNPAIAGEFTADLEALLDEARSYDAEMFQELRLDALLDEAAELAAEVGDEEAEENETSSATLADRFLCPPFSVLDSKQGYWRDRKRAWLALGIESHLGRLDLNYSKNSVFYGNSPWAGNQGPKVAHKAMNTEDNLYGATGTSIFDPVLAEVLLSWFCPPKGRVLDPFAGGSVRGIVAAALGRSYVGLDISQHQIEENRRQWQTIGPKLTEPAEPLWILGDSTQADTYGKVEGDFDFLLSCPPYFDLEVYSDDPADLSNFEPDAFRRAYRETVHLSCERLKPDRFAAFVVGEVREKGAPGAYRGLVPLTIEAFEAAGLHYYNELSFLTAIASLPLRCERQFRATRKVGKAHQNVLVFFKGSDPKRAVEALGPVEVRRIGEDGDDGGQEME